MTEDVLIFDGDCGFCTRCVQWGRRNGVISGKAVPFQQIDPSDFALSAADVKSAVWLVTADGTSVSGSDAISALFVTAGMPYSIPGRFMQLPFVSSLARRGYRVVAKNRHRLPASTCSIDDRA